MKPKLNTYQTRKFNAEDAEVFAQGAEEYLRVPLRIPPRPLRLILISLVIVLAAVTVSAQRKPSQSTRPFVVMSSQSLDDLQKKLHSDNKTEELIDSKDNVYYVMDGSATLVLGSKLEAPKETDPGEWRSPRIVDGKTFEIKKGDLVVVPRGTPHQRSTANKDFTMILIKI